MKEVKEDAKEAGKEQSRVTGLSAGKLNFRHTYTQIHYTLYSVYALSKLMKKLKGLKRSSAAVRRSM